MTRKLKAIFCFSNGALAAFDESGEQVLELQRAGWLGMVADCLRQWGATISEIEALDILLPDDKHAQLKRQGDGSWWWETK